MYERMLNKQEQPQYNEMCMHCKECGELFAGLNTWLMETFATHQDITFPYGNITAGELRIVSVTS